MDRDRVGVRTTQIAHAVLRAALEDALREEIIPRNVAKLARPPRSVARDREPDLLCPKVAAATSRSTFTAARGSCNVSKGGTARTNPA